jgi:WD40 repeat protein
MSEILSSTVFIMKGHFSSIYSIVSAGGSNFFSGSADKNIVKWNLATGKNENFSASLLAPVYSLAYDAGKDYLFAGNGIGQVHFINLQLKAEEKCLQLSKAILFDLLLFEETGLLISGSADGWLHAIETHSGKILWAKKIGDFKIRQLRKLDDSNFLVACGDGSFSAFSKEGSELFVVNAHKESCNTLFAFPSSNVIFSGGKDAHLNVFELSSLKLLESIPAHNFAIYDLALHPEKNYLASCSRDKTIKIWNPETATFLLRIENPNQGGHSHSVNRLFWSGHENLLVSGGDDRMLIVRKIE